MSDKEYCKQHVYSGHRSDFRGHRCSKYAKKDGYCGIHHPEAAKERRRSADEKRIMREESRPISIALKRIAQLEALIADAPHEEWCNVVLTGPRQDCDCWKSRALDTKEKSND